MRQTRRKNVRVIHPTLGSFVAEGVRDNLEAVIMAGRHWKQQWSRVARSAKYEEVE